MRKRIYEDIAADLEKRITRRFAAGLPTVVDLSREYRVSYRTMWKALQVLVKKGLVATSPGRRAMPVRTSPRAGSAQAVSPWPTSSDRLFDKLRRLITEGTYQSGRPLPKRGFFAATFGVSCLTVSHVFRRLSQEGLAHRHGRSWIVGPPRVRISEPVIRQSSGHAPVVLIQVADDLDWMVSFQGAFMHRFMVPFTGELMNYSFQLRQAVRNRLGAASAMRVPVDAMETRSLIRDLGKRYCGTLVVSVMDEVPSIGDQLARLLSLGKPVVFFDHADCAAMYTRDTFAVRKGFFRLYQDEPAGVLLAVKELASHGHRRIGIHCTSPRGWVARRIECLREVAATMDPAISVEVSQPAEDAWGYLENVTEIHRFTSRASDRLELSDRSYDDLSTEDLRRFRALLIRSAPSMVSLLSDFQPTALVALNDAMAREQYFWLKALGADLPRRLSLVSFDSSPESALFPFATVDWGFARLGYLAAHIFIGDLPVRADRKGFIPGQCTLIDRGSIAAPGRQADLARLLDSQNK